MGYTYFAANKGQIMAMIVEDSAQRAQQLLTIQGEHSAETKSVQSLDGFDAGKDLTKETISESLTGSKSQPATKNSNQESTNGPFPISRLKDLLETVISTRPNLSCRDYLVAITLVLMFECDTTQTSNIIEQRAMLLHASLLDECRLPSRAIDLVDTTNGSGFLQEFVEIALLVITSHVWKDTLSTTQTLFNTSDLADGRLFLKLLSIIQKGQTDGSLVLSAREKFDSLASLVQSLCGRDLQFESSAESSAKSLSNGKQSKTRTKSTSGPSIPTKVLPFNNPVLREHLKPVRLEVDNASKPEISDTTSTIFKELSHWHNHRRLIDQKANTALTPRQIMYAQRRNQFFMAEMRDYAASLTNAVGGILEPESVFVVSAKDRELKAAPKWAKEKNKPGKQPPAKANKPTVRDIAASARQEKQNEALDKQIQKWSYKRDVLDQDQDLANRFTKTQQYLASVPSDKRSMVEAEILTYLLSTLIEVLTGQPGNHESIMASTWDVICRISKLKTGITADIVECVTNTVKNLGLPAIDLEAQSHRKLSFKFPSVRSKDVNLGGTMSPTEFQLVHAGPFMDRNMDSAPDPRVHDFEPDKWQRDVLDQIDAKHSLFVVAPTSAGKTFIS